METGTFTRVEPRAKAILSLYYITCGFEAILLLLNYLPGKIFYLLIHEANPKALVCCTGMFVLFEATFHQSSDVLPADLHYYTSVVVQLNNAIFVPSKIGQAERPLIMGALSLCK